MKSRLLTAAAAGLGMLTFTAIAQAAPFTIDFDPFPSTGFTGGLTNPGDENYVDGPFAVHFFWAQSGSFFGGHSHIGAWGVGGSNGEAQHFNGASELQGIVIERVDLQPFSLASLDYFVAGTQSITGFSSTDVNILLAESFDPLNAVSAEFTGFGVGGNSVMFSTLSPGGFGNVSRLFIASSASAILDNIVLDDAAGVPEPATLALFGIGLAGLGFARRRMRG